MGDFSLQNKTALITGGGSGIGRAIAETFASNQAEVHIVDIDKEAALAALKAIESQGGKAHIHHLDITDYDQIKTLVQDINKKQPVELLINNAGVAHVGTVETTDESAMDKLYAVNIKGVFNCTKACIPAMKQMRKGVILNLGSIAGTVGIKDRFAYSMTKGAVLAMTYSIAKDYILYNIRCNSISPARVHTPFVDGFIAKNYPGKEKEQFEKLAQTQPIGRMGTPHEIAHLALFLCSEQASFITGTDYPIDGGFIKLNGN